MGVIPSVNAGASNAACQNVRGKGIGILDLERQFLRQRQTAAMRDLGRRNGILWSQTYASNSVKAAGAFQGMFVGAHVGLAV